jgi:hypothetical protein
VLPDLRAADCGVEINLWDLSECRKDSTFSVRGTTIKNLVIKVRWIDNNYGASEGSNRIALWPGKTTC